MVETLLKPIEMAGNEVLDAGKGKKQIRCISGLP
jgi:hypothetical protein